MTFRPYAHQVEAAEKAICDRTNLVVATGTGSGKTESFLIPVLHRLTTAQAAGELEDRVYALVVYPMNALAEDQRRRLRDALDGTEFTFGRLTGDTAPSARVTQDGPELLTRKAMIERPPHILITNYSMLDRLLLLSAYKRLFARSPDFIVMDEAHGYSGAKGREVSILLQRVAASADSGSPDVRPQYLALSATLGGGESDNPAVENFAQSLFSDPDREVGVIRPKRRTDMGSEDVVQFTGDLEHFSVEERSGMSTRVHLFARTPLGVFACLTKSCVIGHQNLYTDVTPESATCPRCKATRVELAFCVACGAEHIVEADRWVSGNRYKERYLLDYEGLVDPSLRRDVDPELGLEPHNYDIEGPDRTVPVLKGHNESCLACGHKDGAYGALRRLSAPVNDVAVALTTALYPLLPEKGLLEGAAAENLVRTVAKHYSEYVSAKSVTPSSPNLRAGLSGLSHQNLLKVLVEYTPPLVSDKTEALTSPPVLANARVPDLLTNRGNDEPEAAWKKLLVFSDNRQDAAYFASYVEDAYQVSADRLAVYSVLSGRDPGDWVQVKTLVKKLEARYPDYEADREGHAAVAVVRELLSVDHKESLIGLGLALASLDPRIMNEVVARVHARLQSHGFPFNTDEAHGLVEGVVSGLLRDRVLDADLTDDQVQVATGYRGSLRHLLENSSSKGKTAAGVVSWLPAGFANSANTANRRTNLVEKYIQNPKRSDVVAILDVILEELKAAKVLSAPKGNLCLALERLAMRLAGDSDFECPVCGNVSEVRGPCSTWKCKGNTALRPRQRSTYWASLRSGKLHATLPPLRAEEHTAQLSSDTASTTQQDFTRASESDRPVNLLSCSTTFEMGVDVGDVGVVLCRTVPPRPANYVQRAGRAGRRKGAVPVVVTVMRSSEPRDMRIWENPADDLVRGVIPVPPVAAPTVELLSRHLYAEMIAETLRLHKFNELGLSLRQWYLPPEGDAQASLRIDSSPSSTTFKRLASALTKDLGNSGQDVNSELILQGRLLSEGSMFAHLVGELLDDSSRGPLLAAAAQRCGDRERIAFSRIDSVWAELERTGQLDTDASREQEWRGDPLIDAWLAFIDEYAELDRDRKKKLSESTETSTNVKGLDATNRALSRLQSRDAIGHMANSGGLPKFGFPAHQLELKVLQGPRSPGGQVRASEDLHLARDGVLALREYFPGNRLTAGKSRIQVMGVQRAPFGRTYELRTLTKCKDCGRTSSRLSQSQPPENCGACGSINLNHIGGFLRPEWGFYGYDEGTALQSYQPKTTAATQTVYEDPAAWQGQGKPLVGWQASGFDPALLQKFVYASSRLYCCWYCGFAREANGSGSLDKFQEEHRQVSRKLSQSRRNQKGNECPRSRKEYSDLEKWKPCRLFLREPAKAARLEWFDGRAMPGFAGGLVADLLRYSLARQLNTDPDDIDVQRITRLLEDTSRDATGALDNPEDSHETTGFLLCDAVPGGSGLIETACAANGGVELALGYLLDRVRELLAGKPDEVRAALRYVARRSGTVQDLSDHAIEETGSVLEAFYTDSRLRSSSE